MNINIECKQKKEKQFESDEEMINDIEYKQKKEKHLEPDEEMINDIECKQKKEKHLLELQNNLDSFVKAVYSKIKNGKKAKKYQHYDNIWEPKLELNCEEISKSKEAIICAKNIC